MSHEGKTGERNHRQWCPLPIASSLKHGPLTLCPSANDAFGEMSGRVDEQLSLLDGLIGDDIAAFNDMVRQANVEPVVVV